MKMNAQKIAKDAFSYFMNLVQDVPQEVYWDAADELSSMLECVDMERQEHEEDGDE